MYELIFDELISLGSHYNDYNLYYITTYSSISSILKKFFY